MLSMASKKDSVRKEIVVFPDTMKISVQNQQPTSARPSEPLTEKDGRNTSRRKSLRGRIPSGKLARQPCRDYTIGKCTRPSCDFLHPPECEYDERESGCNFGVKCAFMHRQVGGQPSKKTKKNGDTSSAAKLKDARQLGCVFQDIEPQKSSPILRKSTRVLRLIRRVQFSKATLRHANISKFNLDGIGHLR